MLNKERGWSEMDQPLSLLEYGSGPHFMPMVNPVVLVPGSLFEYSRADLGQETGPILLKLRIGWIVPRYHFGNIA